MRSARIATKDAMQFAHRGWTIGYVLALVAVAGGLRLLAMELSFPVALGTLLVALIAALGGSWFDRKTGLLAGALAAVDPTLVAYSHYLFAETLFTLLLVAALVGVIRGRDRSSWALSTSTGVLFGVAALTRELAIPIAGMCTLWWIGIAQAGTGAGPSAKGACSLSAWA
jgi:4-amino-4-deoxy-L-arabinose transferase-like glycosyltransferase